MMIFDVDDSPRCCCVSGTERKKIADTHTARSLIDREREREINQTKERKSVSACLLCGLSRENEEYIGRALCKRESGFLGNFSAVSGAFFFGKTRASEDDAKKK